ncbi:enoyl-CoA hydratase [Labrenzia aggregata]|uniref:Enoyl-CoA hydratase n=1 Tax=Roseibium aggregatum TaxID=187304 RepID=A0A926P5T7_9HYPH|nr:enoyl-CoA hydratase [Roseibium aggregatum]
MPVTIERRGTAAIVLIDNPPVNGISAEIRKGLFDAVTGLSAAGDVDRVIVTGAGKIFCAGADTREFDLPPVEPHLPDVINAIEASSVPWIAAINGAALGGGAEIALACRYRIASPKSTIGLPEVTLGVVPGASGTQRLPRLIGMAAALDIIPQGKVLKTKAALEIGLIDRIEDDPVEAALGLDADVFSSVVPLAERAAPEADEAAVEAARAQASKRMRGQTAPLEAIDLVAASANTPFTDALTREREAFLRLRSGDQAKALRHIFFAERGAKVPEPIASAEAADVRQAIVVGGGNMGASIAYALDSAGISATIVETDADGAERAAANVARLADGAAKRGLLTAEQAEACKARIAIVTGYDDLPPAQLAIEAAFEDMDVKKTVFANLEKALPEDAVLATNTSYLDINEIAASVSNPARVVGLHFFSPAHIMKLLEIVRGSASADTALATGFAVAKRLRKIPVLSGVCDGFIGNRILARYREAADTVMMDGSNPWEVDEAMVDFGYPMGPYEAQDLSGLDIAYANRKRQAATRDPNRRYIPIADRMVHEGRLGRKTSVGWYRYPGGGGTVVDPLVEDLVREEAHFAKVTRRDYTPDEIRTRLVCAMINEAADILEEGIAHRASDIDLVTVHGYGFPRWRGGLMFHADQIGLDKVLANIDAFAEEDPVAWKASPLLRRLAESGKTFAEL